MTDCGFGRTSFVKKFLSAINEHIDNTWDEHLTWTPPPPEWHPIAVHALRTMGFFILQCSQERNFKNFHPNWAGSKLTLDVVEKQSWDAALKVKLNWFDIYQMSDI